MLNLNKPDKLLSEDIKNASEKEVLDTQCFLLYKQLQVQTNQFETQKKIKNRLDFFFYLTIFQLALLCVLLFWFFIK